MYVYIDSPRPFAAFQITGEENDRRPRKNPLTVYSLAVVLFSKQRWKALVLFSKLASKWERPTEPTLFSFLNFALTRARACVYVHKPTRRRHPKTAKKGAFALFKPYKAVVSHFMGAIDRFYVPTCFVSYKGFYGRGRAWEYAPHTPLRYQREWQGAHFQPPYIGNIAQGV